MAAACAAGSLKVHPPFLPHVLGLPPASHTHFHSSSDSDGGDEDYDEEEWLVRERPLDTAVGRNVAATAAEALNSSQRTALEGFCNARTGALQLVQGPPGCGKTMLVVAVLHALRARGLRVLLCAPSNKVRRSTVGCVCVWWDTLRHTNTRRCVCVSGVRGRDRHVCRRWMGVKAVTVVLEQYLATGADAGGCALVGVEQKLSAVSRPGPHLDAHAGGEEEVVGATDVFASTLTERMSQRLQRAVLRLTEPLDAARFCSEVRLLRGAWGRQVFTR